MSVELSKRLQAIANFVKPGSKIIDVGTDHAYVPIWLISNGICDYAIATDIHSGPLEKAKQDAYDYGVSDRIQFYQCNGLTACSDNAVDTIIIAGLGGDTIISILSNSLWALDKLLIIQSQTKLDLLLDWFNQYSMAIIDGRIVFENDHYYVVWVVSRSNKVINKDVEEFFLKNRDPLIYDYLEIEIKKLTKQIMGLKSAINPDLKFITELENRMKSLLEYQKEVVLWQQ